MWFVAADTVYKAVPYNVVADWAAQGRLARTDKVRPTGTQVPWVTVSEHELLADYLARPSPAKAVPAKPAAPPLPAEPARPTEPAAEAPGESVELPDPDPPTTATIFCPSRAACR